jgi:hypothetical protein
VDLFGNSFHGTLPASWAQGGFPSLQILRLAFNNISGQLPGGYGSLGALPSLQRLYLNDNDLEGGLPSEWGSQGGLKQLQMLFLGGNARLSGGRLALRMCLPLCVETTRTLHFSTPTPCLPSSPPPGTLPEAWASPSALPSLNLLSIMGANLSGGLPPSWGAPGALLNLTDLILSGELANQLQLLLIALQASCRQSYCNGAGRACRAAGTNCPAAGNRLAGELPCSWGAPGALPLLSGLILSFNSLATQLPSCWGRPGGPAAAALASSGGSSALLLAAARVSAEAKLRLHALPPAALACRQAPGPACRTCTCTPAASRAPCPRSGASPAPSPR